MGGWGGGGGWELATIMLIIFNVPQTTPQSLGQLLSTQAITHFKVGYWVPVSNQLFLPSIHTNTTGYCEKNVSEIIEATFKIHLSLKKLVLVLGISFS